jgi:phytoene dehydrogenase-like protein
MTTHSESPWIAPPAPTSPGGMAEKRQRMLTPERLGPLKPTYDLVVIGSGLAGLTAANRMARAGHSVLLLEQHYNFGGLATWFKRPGGHIFDISLHGFPAGMIKTCRKYWSKEIADSIVQLERIRFDNPQFRLETKFDRDDFTELLTKRFEVDPGAVSRFFDTARSMNFYDDQSKTTRELFEEFFPGRKDVWRLLMEPIAYANGSTLDDPAITYGIVFSNFMSKGVYTFSGGTDQLIKAMKRELAKNGVTIKNYAQVEQILVDGPKGARRVRGVKVNGRTVEATAVISNANVVNTVLRLTGEDHFDAEYLEAAKAVRMNTASSQVYLGLARGETIPEIGDLFFTSSAPEFDSDALCALECTSRTFSFYYPDLRPGSELYSVVASINSRFDDWAAMDDATYVETKERYAREAIEVLERYIPDVSKKIEHVEVSTPRTFEFYTQHLRATSFGTKFEGLKVSQDLPKQVAGLFHAGSVGIIMSGWLGAANYGVIVANEADRYLAQQGTR